MFSRVFIILYTFGLLQAKTLIAVDHSGKFFASSYEDGNILLWDIEKGNLVFSYSFDCERITDIDVYSDYDDTSLVSTAASCSDGSIISINKNGERSYQKTYPPFGDVIAVGTMNFSLDGQYLYCFGNTDVGFITNAVSGNFENYISSALENDPIESKLSLNNKHLIAGYSDGRLSVWDVNWDEASNKSTIQLSKSIITDLALSSNGTAAIADRIDYLYLYRYENNKLSEKKKIITNGYASTVLFNRQGNGLLTGHGNGRINYWQIKGNSIEFLDHSEKVIHIGIISDMVLQPDEKQTIVISAGVDNYIRFTDFKDYTIMGTIYRDETGWVVYNKNGGYTGTIDIPESFPKKTNVENPFDGIF